MDGGIGESIRTVEIVSCFRLYYNVVFCVQVRRPYSLTSFIHSASLRSFTPFASPVKSDGCATPLFCYFHVSAQVIVWLCSGDAQVMLRLCCGWGGAPVGL